MESIVLMNIRKCLESGEVGTMVLGAAAVLKRVVASEGVAYPVFQN